MERVKQALAKEVAMDKIQKGSTVNATKRITGMVVSHEIGTKLNIISVYDDWCTLEDMNGVGCIVGVPLSHVKLAM